MHLEYPYLLSLKSNLGFHFFTINSLFPLVLKCYRNQDIIKFKFNYIGHTNRVIRVMANKYNQIFRFYYRYYHDVSQVRYGKPIGSGFI